MIKKPQEIDPLSYWLHSNAEIGSKTTGDKTKGRYSFSYFDTNGAELLNFCEVISLIITGTSFQHKANPNTYGNKNENENQSHWENNRLHYQCWEIQTHPDKPHSLCIEEYLATVITYYLC